MGTSKRKRQTRLTFSPLPSSSPAAAVRYDSSPGPVKRRKVRDAPGSSSLHAFTVKGDDHAPVNRLPTPDATATRLTAQSASANDDSEDDSDVVVVSSRTRAKRQAATPSDDDSPIENVPRARKRLRRPDPIAEEERQDLEEDLLDLASSGSDTEIRPSQKKVTTKSAREQALARYKQRRGGASQVAVDEEKDQDTDEDEDGQDDDSFVVDDAQNEDGPLDVPSNIPIAFTRYASMKAKDLFKFAIDWMIQKKINPAFQINDEIYDLTFKKLDDEVRGLAGSKFTSSAWTQEFTFTLQARPDLEYSKINRAAAAHFMRDKCDACNRSGHPATYEVRFEGQAYDKETLEIVAGTENTDSDTEDSLGPEEDDCIYDRDSKGRPIASTSKVFYLGKFCMSNAQTAHSLSHWKYHLYEWVVDYLNAAGYNAPQKIVKRDSWSTRKRRKYANKIVDAMQADGKVKELYRDFKNEIDSARSAKMGRFDSSP